MQQMRAQRARANFVLEQLGYFGPDFFGDTSTSPPNFVMAAMSAS